MAQKQIQKYLELNSFSKPSGGLKLQKQFGQSKLQYILLFTEYQNKVK